MIFGNDSKAIPLYQSLSIDFQKNIQSYLVGLRTLSIYERWIEHHEKEALMIDQKLDTYQSSYPYRVEIEMQKDLIQNINSLRTIDFVDLQYCKNKKQEYNNCLYRERGEKDGSKSKIYRFDLWKYSKIYFLVFNPTFDWKSIPTTI